MIIFRKQYVILIIILVAAASVLAGLKIIQFDWQVAHRSKATNLPPINWLGYEIEYNLAKAKKYLFKTSSNGLPPVHLYIGQQAQNALIEDVPTSTKEWQRAYKLSADGKLVGVKVRHRGDNPVNWIFNKKSWRVKTSKKKLENRIRTVDYIAPQGVEWDEYTGLLIADAMGLIVPHFRLVELYINGHSFGVYLEKEKLNETFLRNKGFMPVNLYKGEQYNLEWKLRVDDALFNNPRLWKKLANFNQKPKHDFGDLQTFLEIIRQSESSVEARLKLFEKVPIDVWARYAAFQIIGGGFHNDWKHNQRLISDPWSGYTMPTPTDIAPAFFGKQPLETSADEVLRLLNQMPSFLDRKYEVLYEAVNKNRILAGVVSKLKELRDPFHISSQDDLHRIQSYYSGLLKRPLIGHESLMEYFDAYCEGFLKNESLIKTRLEAAPSATWRALKSSIALQIHDEIPAKDLTLTFENKLVRPPKIYFDRNNNHQIDDTDIELPVQVVNGRAKVTASWYANRIPVTDVENGSELSFLDLRVASTEFRLLFEDNSLPIQAWVSNPFTNKFSKIRKIEKSANLPSALNLPLIQRPEDKFEIWSGTKVISSDQVFRVPVRILPGTRIKLEKGVNVVFRRKVQFLGKENAPIIVEGSRKDIVWGAIAVLGPDASGSVLQHTHFRGGSGGEVDGVRFIGMLSIHNSSQIQLLGLRLSDNQLYDDMFHCVYCSDVQIVESVFERAKSDAIDIDISKNMQLKSLLIEGSGNDAIDLMTSEAAIVNTTLARSGDKGLSVGEASVAFLVNSRMLNNSVGLQSKDGSTVYAFNADFLHNNIHLSAYSKNWRYGAGGNIDIRKSLFSGGDQLKQINDGSRLYMFDNSLEKPAFEERPNQTSGAGGADIEYASEDQEWGIELPDIPNWLIAHMRANWRGSRY